MSLDLYRGVSRTSRVLSIIALLGLAGSADAALFSFASDDASSQFTFQGTAAAGNSFSVTHTGTRVPVTLKIDDNNGALPTVTLNAGMVANLTLSWVGSAGMGNSQTHAYSATGSITFENPTDGTDYLVINLTGQSPAGMAIGGTMTQWASAGGLFGSDNAGGGSVSYTTTAALFAAVANLNAYGIFGGANSVSTGPDDFGFSLSFVNAVTGGLVPIDGTSRLPTAAWRAEGSFSGSANWVPTPGSVAMLGAAGMLLGARRKRR